MVEIDVRRTLDGEFVLMHDARVGGRPFGRFSVEMLNKRLPRGETWPRLREVAQHCHGKIRLDVELKVPGDEREIAEILGSEMANDEFVITSFQDDAVAAVKRAFPDIRAGLLLGTSRPSAVAQAQDLFPFGRVERCNADFIVPHATIADTLINRALRHKLGVMIWMMGRERRLRHFVMDSRLDAVITDRVQEALSMRGDPTEQT